MKPVEIVVRVQFSKPVAGLLLAASLLCLAVPDTGSESLTMTTYYPAPAGVYQRLTTTGTTLLARDGGRVGIGTTSPEGALEIKSTTAGFIPPRMTTAQRDAVAAEGSIVYNTERQSADIRTRTGWKPLGGALASDVGFAALAQLNPGCSAGSWDVPSCVSACNRWCTGGASGTRFTGGAMVDTAAAGVRCLCVP